MMKKHKILSVLLCVIMACGTCVAVAADDTRELDMSQAKITSSELFVTQGVTNPNPLEFQGENAFDGDVYTYWQPLANQNGNWLRMDFEEPVTFNRAKIYEQINYDQNRYNTVRFKVQYSDDGERWKDACEGGEIGRCSDMKFNAVTTRHVRLIVKPKDTQNPQIGEVRLFYEGGHTSEEIVASVGSSDVFVNGALRQTERGPIAQEGEVFLPADLLKSLLGLNISYNGDTQQITIINNLSGEKTYYVAKDGNDENSGTIDAPFLTVSRAAAVMEAGDTCIIREGTYRETVVPKNSGAKDKPITFKAYPGETVIISGAEVLEGEWSPYQSNIYQMEAENKYTQLFVDGRMMNVARWPNASVNDVIRSECYATADKADYSFVTCSGLPAGDWNGADLYIWPGSAWNGYHRTVTYNGGNQLDFTTAFPPRTNGLDLGDPWKPIEGNKFYIYGVLAALDIGGEWVQDKKDQKLYLYTEQGDSPNNHTVEVKQRDWAFDLFDKNYINLENLQIFGAAINMAVANNCTVDTCYVVYPSDDNLKSVKIEGEGNTVKNSYIAYCPGDGVTLYGENNVVDNCIIHDVNTYGDMYAAVQTNGVGNKITNNTMYNAGRSFVLHYYSRKMNCERNYMRNGGILSLDLGATYAYGHNNYDGSQGSVIAYNWIFDMYDKVGIYLDSYQRGYYVHHNVVKNCETAMVVNGGGINNTVYNNTFIGEKIAYYSITFSGQALVQTGTKFVNNIMSGMTMLSSGENAAQLTNNVAAAVDDKYLPLKGSPAVDKGIVLPENTESYTGKGPDIGAYELGGAYWVPGANWTVPEGIQ